MFSFLPGMILWLHLIITCGLQQILFHVTHEWKAACRHWLFHILVESFHRLLPRPPSWRLLSFQHSLIYLSSSHLRKCSSNSDIQYFSPNSVNTLDWALGIFFSKMFFFFFAYLTVSKKHQFGISILSCRMQIQGVGGFQYVSIHSPSIILQPFEPTSLF